jgi:hypothetical protein
VRAGLAATLLLTFVFFSGGCSNAPVGSPSGRVARTFVEVSLLEQICMTKLQGYLIKLDAKRMDSFFGAALNGLVSCEASSGLSHVPTKAVTDWLAHANGRVRAAAIPKAPRELAALPATDDDRVPYQGACVSYMRRYIPASIARAGDEPDVAAAFTFNALEECDSDSGFATITPSDLAAIMQAKHLL